MSQWKNNQKVLYISNAGTRSVREIGITLEGFAVIIDNEEEILFSQNGKPINHNINEVTGGPKIEQIIQTKQKQTTDKLPNYLTATFDNPWDNVFGMKNLTVSEWKVIIDLLCKFGHGNRKMHLKNIGENASDELKDQIKDVFNQAKERINNDNI